MRYVGIISVLLFLLFSCQKEYSKVENMTTFAKVYGYVKYFHPSDEATQIDWNRFSIYGATQIDQCKTKKEVIKTLNRLFNPIAPSVKFAANKNDFDIELKDIIPDNKELFRFTYWQHLGVSTGMKNKGNPYISRRINRMEGIDGYQLFDYEPEFGECITEEIGEGIYCQIPIVLYCDKENTFPHVSKPKLEDFKEELNNVNVTNLEYINLRLGNIVNVYGVFQHFYPYFDVVKADWDSELRKAIDKSYSDQTIRDHLITLEKFTAPLNDGHIRVNANSINDSFIPPVFWEWIENNLVITQVLDNNDAIKPGDIVTQINNREPIEYFKEIYERISAGTETAKHYTANYKSLMGKKWSKIAITINGKNIELVRSLSYYSEIEFQKQKKYKYLKIEKGIWYLNLDIIEMNTINKLLPQLENCKAIICDLRGYPKGNHGFINHLMAIDDTTKAWMQTPKIVYPDHNRTIGYKSHNWIGMIKAEKPYLGNKKVVFITDGRAISYAESYLGYIEGYKLATIVGQSTAGTNGNINPFNLPGGVNISWTGMKVVKHDGSQHHGIGILPDIYVEKTIQGIIDNRDEFLEKALEIARK